MHLCTLWFNIHTLVSTAHVRTYIPIPKFVYTMTLLPGIFPTENRDVGLNGPWGCLSSYVSLFWLVWPKDSRHYLVLILNSSLWYWPSGFLDSTSDSGLSGLALAWLPGFSVNDLIFIVHYWIRFPYRQKNINLKPLSLKWHHWITDWITVVDFSNTQMSFEGMWLDHYYLFICLKRVDCINQLRLPL